jgi:hypothetical protein
VRYGPDWSREAFALAVDEEFFVLDGELRINDQIYRNFSYGFLPAGYSRTGMTAAEDTVVLTFLSGDPRLTPAASNGAAYEEYRLVLKVDALASPLSTEFSVLGVKSLGKSETGIKSAAFLLLREDPVTHDQTWLLAARPLWRGRVQEIHPVVEEMYLLSGDLITPMGLMRAGAYFWRPPGVPHGPFASKTGNLMFFRTVGGALTTTYTGGTDQFNWTPAHRPVLPPELEAYGRKPNTPTPCF